jgi:hypothetical protein
MESELSLYPAAEPLSVHNTDQLPVETNERGRRITIEWPPSPESCQRNAAMQTAGSESAAAVAEAGEPSSGESQALS